MSKSVLAFLSICASFATQAPAVAHAIQSGPSGRANAIASKASSFLAALTAEQRARIVRPLEDNAARTNWSNLPSDLYERSGVALAEMTPLQRIAFHDLLSMSLSSQGYGKATAIMWIEDLLQQEESERLRTSSLTPERRIQLERRMQSRQSDNYWVSIFGRPGTARWGWMVSGHHLAANFTVVDGRIAFTPLFVGVEPQTVRHGRYAGWRVLGHEIESGFELLRSLDERQQRAAKIGDVIGDDLFTGKGRKDSLTTIVGLPTARLNSDQQDMLWRLLREFIGSAADEAAEAQLEAVRKDGLGKLHFAWWGDADDPAKRFMYRVHGPSILIEYVREARGGEPANHVHAIIRDPRNDYGEDWLRKHYREKPHP